MTGAEAPGASPLATVNGSLPADVRTDTGASSESPRSWWRYFQTRPLMIAFLLVVLAFIVGFAVGLTRDGTWSSRLYVALNLTGLLSGVFVSPAMAFWAWSQSDEATRRVNSAIADSRDASVAAIQNVGADLDATVSTEVKNAATAGVAATRAEVTATLAAINTLHTSVHQEMIKLQATLNAIEGLTRSPQDIADAQRLLREQHPAKHSSVTAPSPASEVESEPQLPRRADTPDNAALEAAVLAALGSARTLHDETPTQVSFSHLLALLKQEFGALDWDQVIEVFDRLHRADQIGWSMDDEDGSAGADSLADADSIYLK